MSPAISIDRAERRDAAIATAAPRSGDERETRDVERAGIARGVKRRARCRETPRVPGFATPMVRERRGAARYDDRTGGIEMGPIFIGMIIAALIGYLIGKGKGQGAMGAVLGGLLGVIGWIIVAVMKPAPGFDSQDGTQL